MAEQSRHIKRSEKRDTKFFESIAQGKTVTRSAKDAGYLRRSVYQCADNDPEFARRWEEAREQAVERLEEEVDRRAVDGTKENVYYQGEKIGTVRRYSDTLLIFRLKALAPKKYRDYGPQPETGPPPTIVINRPADAG